MPPLKDAKTPQELVIQAIPMIQQMVKDFLTPNNIDSSEQKSDHSLRKENLERAILRFGLQDGQDVTAFWSTEAGISVKEEIQLELLHQKELAEENMEAQQEKDLQDRLMTIALFLWVKEQEENGKERQTLLDEVEKVMEALQESELQSSEAEDQTVVKSNGPSSPYQSPIDKLNHQYQQLLKRESKLLESESKLLVQQQIDMDKKYNLYEQSVGGAGGELFDKIDKGSTSEVDMVQLEEAQTQLKKDHEEAISKVNDAIETDQDPKEALYNANAINLKLGVLKDMCDVQKGDKYYADTNGNKTNRASAEFILKKDETLIKDQDKHYLLDKGKSWDNSSEQEKKSSPRSIRTKQNRHNVSTPNCCVQ
jgi:hypothetical protein